jgi:uncharacterized protein DUF4440
MPTTISSCVVRRPVGSSCVVRLLVATTLFAIGCTSGRSDELTLAQKQTIRTEVEQALREAYDLSKPNLPDRMLALYPKSGRIVSAAGGRVLTSRDSLEMGIRYFWNNVGSNMREPRWIWEDFYVDVLSPTSAVVTATYRIPHRTPRNEPHELGGAMTVVFEKREGRWVVVQEHLSDLPAPRDSTSTSMPTHEHH